MFFCKIYVYALNKWEYWGEIHVDSTNCLVSEVHISEEIFLQSLEMNVIFQVFLEK